MFGQRWKRILTGAGVGGSASVVLTSAAVGAMVGTIGLPGIGTLVGAVVGAVVAGVVTGAIFGGVYDKAKQPEEDVEQGSTSSMEEEDSTEEAASTEEGEPEDDKSKRRRKDPVLRITREEEDVAEYEAQIRELRLENDALKQQLAGRPLRQRRHSADSIIDAYSGVGLLRAPSPAAKREVLNQEGKKTAWEQSKFK